MPLPDDVDAPLDLQAVLERVWEDGGYEDLIDYDSPPPAPALDAADAQWVAEPIRRWRAAPAPGR